MSGPKLAQPRKLGETETIQSLNHWKNHFRNFFRRCEYVGMFLDPVTTWDPADPDGHGFTDETTGQKRTKQAIKADLEGFFDTLASYMPYDYVSSKCMKETKCINDVWSIIYEIYDAEVNPDSFLSYISLKKEPVETYRNFWNRLVNFVEQHLASTPVTVEGATVPATGDKISVTTLDLITMHWMAVIDPRLTAVVKTEFTTELKTQRISELVKRIAVNVDELLKRYGTPRDQVSAVQQPQLIFSAEGAAAQPAHATDTCKHDADIIRRIDRLERKTQRSNRRDQREKGRIH